jgi:hypothetical protein
MGSWARVGDKIPLLIPAQFGVLGARWASAVISIICAWQTIGLARDLKMPNAHWAAVFLIFQPFVFTLAGDTMTELPFALGTIIAIRLWMNNRLAASCMVMGYMPTVRPEGFFLCALWGAILIYRHRPALLPFLGWGTIAWFIACWVLRGNPTYFFREGWSWPADSLRVYGYGSFFAHVNRWPVYCGPVLLGLFVVGVWKALPFGSRLNKIALGAVVVYLAAILSPGWVRENVFPWPGLALAAAIAWQIRRNRFALGITVFLLIFTLHSVLWWRGWFGSCGLMRILACVSPITAIVCLKGWNVLAPRMPVFARGVTVGVIAMTAMVYHVIEPMHWRVFPLQRASQFIADQHLLDHAPMIVFGDPMTQAALNMAPNPPNILHNDCNRAEECQHLLDAPIGTVGEWDNQHAEPWFGVGISDLPALGYTILYTSEFRPRVAIEWTEPSNLPREQVYVVIRKDEPGRMPAN